MKTLFLLSALLYNGYLYAQLQIVPIPKVSTLGTYGTQVTTQVGSYPTRSTANSSQVDLYNPHELRQQQQMAQYEIDAATAQMHEIIERQSTALYLIQNGFPSQEKEQGTEHFRNTYQELKRMLCDSIPFNLERAVFLVENAYLSNQLNFQDFQKNISERVEYCHWRLKELKLHPNDQLAKNMSIFSLLTDTLNIKQPETEKTITHYPLKYNLEDYDSKKSYTSHFVTTLLSTNVGQCYSMPLLYLIMAERMGTNAYLSLAPGIRL